MSCTDALRLDLMQPRQSARVQRWQDFTPCALDQQCRAVWLRKTPSWRMDICLGLSRRMRHGWNACAKNDIFKVWNVTSSLQVTAPQILCEATRTGYGWTRSQTDKL